MDMFRGHTHILHNKLRPAKYARIEALENKVPFLPGIECREKRVVDITCPEGLNGCDRAGCSEQIRNGNKIVWGFVIHSVFFSMTYTNQDMVSMCLPLKSWLKITGITDPDQYRKETLSNFQDDPAFFHSHDISWPEVSGLTRGLGSQGRARDKALYPLKKGFIL
jgi:hypothetical protein